MVQDLSETDERRGGEVEQEGEASPPMVVVAK